MNAEMAEFGEKTVNQLSLLGGMTKRLVAKGGTRRGFAWKALPLKEQTAKGSEQATAERATEKGMFSSCEEAGVWEC